MKQTKLSLFSYQMVALLHDSNSNKNLPAATNMYWGFAITEFDLVCWSFFQSVQPLPRDNHILNFLDAEASISDTELSEPRDEFLYHELATADRKWVNKKFFTYTKTARVS